VRTVIQNNGKTPFSEMPQNLYITDGPALWFEQRGAGKFLLQAKSTEGIGKFLSITIFRGERGSPNFEKQEQVQIIDPLICDFEISLNNSLYVRAECETSCGKFAMTMAI
jgi:hypothetical protein